jgi:hypothetical protein
MRRQLFIAVLVLIIGGAPLAAVAQTAPTPPHVYLRQTPIGYSLFYADEPHIRFLAWFRDGVNIGYQAIAPNTAPSYVPDGWRPESTVTLCRWFNDDLIYDMARARCTDITMRLVHLPLISR